MREVLTTRLNAEAMEIIKEKEEQIRGLLEEGEDASIGLYTILCFQASASIGLSTPCKLR